MAIDNEPLGLGRGFGGGFECGWVIFCEILLSGAGTIIAVHLFIEVLLHDGG